MAYLIETLEEKNAIMQALADAGIPCEWSGLNIWCYPSNKMQAADLMMLNARYSKKRDAWYIRAIDSLRELEKQAAKAARQAAAGTAAGTPAPYDLADCPF